MAATYGSRVDSVALDALTPAPGADPELGLLGEGTSRQAYLTTRTPPRFAERVLQMFRTPQNLAYLEGALRQLGRGDLVPGLGGSAAEWGGGWGRGVTLMESDPLTVRGGSNDALDFWSEVRRLNRAFLQGQIRRPLPPSAWVPSGANRGPVRDGYAEAENLAFHEQMFLADSLRPPGLESLNGPGPLSLIEELQSSRTPREVVAGRPARAATAAGYPADRTADRFAADAGMWDRTPLGDQPWMVGDPNRTPEQALAEYWGDGKVSTQTQLGSKDLAGATNLELRGEGPRWAQNGGTRFERYPTIPFWQKTNRGSPDRDIREGLGTQMRDTGNPVRGWNMGRLWSPSGQVYREQTPGYTQSNVV